MKTIKSLGVLIFLFINLSLRAQSAEEISKNRLILPNGWGLTPVGKLLTLGDLPLNIAVSHSQNLLAVTNNGQSTQTIMLIDAVNQKVTDSVEIGSPG